MLFFLGMYNIICISIYYYHVFPAYYNWTEIFISYEGGVVRRGLVGTILSSFAGINNFQLYVITSYLLVYFLWYAFIIKNMFSVFSKSWCLILLGSPAIFAFFYQSAGAFFRKDIFVEIGFALLFYFYYKFSSAYKSCKKALAITLLIYIPCFLIHELMLFYIWLPYFFLVSIYKARKEEIYISLFFALLALASLLFVFSFSGTQEQGIKITDFWNNYYPEVKAYDSSAIKFLGLSLWDKPDYCNILPYLQNKATGSIIKACILAFFPILLLYINYNFHKISNKLFGRSHVILFYVITILSFSAIFIVMNDVGRILSMFSIYLVCYLIFFIKLYKASFNLNVCDNKLSFSLSNPLYFVLSIIYLFSWCVCHWIPLDADSWLSIQIWQNHFLYGFPELQYSITKKVAIMQF